MLKPAKRDPKKSYSSPILTTYGAVKQLTRKVGLRKTPDGGSRLAIKTHM